MHDGHNEGAQAAAVRRQLVQLVAGHGAEILDDSRRVRAMLSDAVAGAQAETNLIGLALSSGVAVRLREAGTDPGQVAGAVERTAEDLERTSSVQPRDARWAVSAIAEALGVLVPAAAPPVPAMASAGPSPSPSPVSPGPDDLLVRIAGTDTIATPGSVVSVGRDPSSTIVVDSPAVSRRHGELRHAGGSWTFTDTGSTQGTYAAGVAVRQQQVRGETLLTLGQGTEAVEMRLVPFGVAETRTPGPLRPVAPAPLGTTELPGQARPGGPLSPGAAPRTELAGTPGDVLTVTQGGVTRRLAPGSVLVVGREQDSDLVVQHPTVSRHHVRIEHIGGLWYLRDLGSTSGTWLGGRRVAEVELRGRQEFMLGDAQRGDRLVTESSAPVVPSPVSAGAGRPPGQPRSTLRWWLVAGAAAAVILVVAAALVAWRVVAGDDTDAPPEAAPVTRDDLARATVFVDAGDFTGSGVIIDRTNGLILTNAHVVAPSATGQGVEQGRYADELPKDPEEVGIFVSAGRDESAEPTFHAKVVAVDGYLDVAVLKIETRYSGAQVEDEDLAALSQVSLGDSDTLATSDPISFFGYPQAAGSRAPTYTPGVVASKIQDDRLGDPSAEINTTASISPGNSGGLAANEAGEMVGIPTWSRQDQEGQRAFSSIRPINLVLPVIEAATKGTKYTSPWTTPAPASARVDNSSFLYAQPRAAGTVTAGCAAAGRGVSPTTVSVRYSGFPGGDHTDVMASLYSADASRLLAQATAVYPTRLKEQGCLTMTFDANLPHGEYRLRIGVGGNYKVVYDNGFQY